MPGARGLPLMLAVEHLSRNPRQISQNQVPLIHDVIPLFDILTTAMDDFIDNIDLHPTVCAAALQGSLLMNKYYSLTDDSIAF
jgi:hypothetical protein